MSEEAKDGSKRGLTDAAVRIEMNQQSVKRDSGRKDSGMFKTERSAKYALFALMAMVAFDVPVLYLQAMYVQVCLMLGLELICYWAYLNPWILQEKYSLFFFVDTSKMVHNRFLVAGAVIFFGSGALIFLRWIGQCVFVCTTS